MIELLGHTIHFQYPWAFLLLLLLPLIAFLHIKDKKKQKSAFVFSYIKTEKFEEQNSILILLRRILPALLLLSLFFLILSLTRLQIRNAEEMIMGEGIDIMMSIDLSGSMLAEDFTPNRMEAAKEKAIEFVKQRMQDRIGLVIFAGESFTLSPLTTDKMHILDQIAHLKSGMLEDGTAIGMGLATAVDRLRNSEAKSKVLILMTDGVNNMGRIDPITALELAKTFDIKVYTVGIGTIGEALFPVPTPQGVRKEMMPVEIDEELLKKISKETGGKYFRAVDNKSLEQIYKEIDQLEKSEIESKEFVTIKELFYYPLMVSIFMFGLFILIQWVISPSLTDD